MDNYTEQSFENSNIIENKANALQNSVTEKIDRLAGTYKGTTRGISDGDTSPVQLEDGSRIKLREANSNGAWYDTGEVEHPGAVGLSKSAAALAPQREQAARLFGKPVEAVTQQDLYDVGNMQTIQRVADEYRSKGEPRWEAPLIKDSVRPNLDVVNAPVEVKLSGKKDMHGRDLGELINPSTGINLTQESTNDPRMNAYYGRTNREKVLSGTASYGDIKPLDLSGSTDYLSNTAVQSYNTARGFGARALDVGAKLGSLIGEGLESFGEGEQVYLDKEQKYLDKTYAGEKVSDWRKELASTIKETGTSLQKSMTEFQKSGKANKLTGYDSSDVDSLHADIDTTIKNDGYVAALGRAITDPRSLEVLVQSLPEMAALAVSVGGMAIANVNNNINIGEAELGRGFTTEEKAMSAASSIVGTYLDRLGDKLALSGMNPAKAALKTAVENAPKEVKEALASTYGKGILAIGEVPLRLGAAGAVEGGTEYGQTLAETAAQTPKVFKEGFTDKQFDEAGVAGVLGFAMGGQIHGAMNAPSIIKEGVQALGEKYDNVVGNLDNGENGKESVGPEGRKNRWESALDVEVAPENRAVYTRDLARYAAEEFVRSGDLEGEYKGNPMKIFEDATERIAKVNQVSSEDAKDMIGRQLAKNVLDVTEQVDAKGNRAFSVDKAKRVLSKFVETIKGNKGAEDVLEKAFEDELAAKFEEVKTRLMKEGVNVDDLSNRGTLTKSELENLEKTLESMKTLGSERLAKRAEAIGNELEARQERLGSEGTDGPKVPPKKTVQEVRNEIETLGFLTRGKKSLEQHTRDLDAYVVDPTADPKDRDQALGAIENFVGSRKAKIDVVNRGKIDASGFTFRSVGELKKFAAETYADNKKIMKVVTETAAKLPEGNKERARLEKMAEHLQDTQKRMVEVQNEGGTVDEDKALLRKVGGWSTFISDTEHKAFEKYVDEYTKSRKEKVQDETETELDELKVEEQEEPLVEKAPKVELEESDEVLGMKDEEEVSAEKEPEVKEEKATQLEKAIEGIEQYTQELKDLLDTKESLIAKKAAIRNLIDEQLKELAKMNAQAKRLDATIKGMEGKTKDSRLEVIVSDLVRRILLGVRLLKGKLQKLLSKIATKTSEKAANEATENRLSKELQDVISKIEALENKLEGKEELLVTEESKTEVDASEFRKGIEEVLGDTVRVNKSEKSSLTARLYSNLDVMDLMPRIIRDNEKGVEKVNKAVETLKEFESKRKRKLVVQNNGADNAVLEKLGLDKLFSDKSIEDKVKKAVHVSSVVALSNMIDARRNKGEQLDKFVDGAFGNLWSKYAEDKPEEKQLKNLITSGKIVPIATFTRDAGRRLLEELEIKLDTKTMQDYDDAVNALGAIVVNNVLWQDGSQAQIAKGTLTLKDGEVVVKSGFDLDVDLGEGNGINVLDVSKLTSKMIEDIGNAGIVFEYAREQSDGVVSLKPITHKEDKTGRNTDVKIGKDAEKYLNEQGSKPWKFDKSFVALWEAIGKDVNVLKEMILGTKEELVKNTDAMEVESALAKYAADELDVERMMMAYELVGDKEFYLGWDYTVSGRNMISNRMINPQNSKISRFVVGMEGMRHTLEVSDGERTMLEHAILQAFDGDPDKKGDAEVRKALKKEGVELNIVNGQYEVTVSEKIERLLTRGTVVSLQGIQKELGIHGAHLMHAYQALTMLKELMANGKEVQTNLAVEADGITNGMATTTLQMGLQVATGSYYEKSGLYVEGLSKYKSHGEFKGDGGKDFYEAPVEAAKAELGAMAELVENVIGGAKKWRSYLKPLVMVYAYGASMKNITKNGSRDLVLKVLNNKDLDIDEVHRQLEGLGVENPKEAYKAEWVLDKNGSAKVRRNPSAKTAYVSEEVLERMAKEVEGKIGGALAKAFGETFKPVTEYRRALKVIHQLNYLVFNNELNKELKELGVSKIGELSKEQMAKLTEKMIKDGTWYGSDTSLGTTQDYFKTQQALGTKGETITVMLPTKWAKYSNGSGEVAVMNKIIKEAASNVGAVGVVDVHNVDGATMIKGHITDVLNIFDALVLGTNFKQNKEQMEAINQAYIDINMNHSILGKAVERLLKNGEKLQEITSIKGQLALDTLADVKRIFAIGTKDNFVEKFNSGMDSIMRTLVDVDAGRRELAGQKIDVKQYYISDALGGGKWEGNKPEGRFAVFSNDPKAAEAEQARVGMMLEKLRSVALALEVKRKEKSSIINKKEKVNNSMAVTATSRRLEASYHESLNKLVKEIVGPEITESEFLGLSKATLDNIAIVGGQYTKGKVTISKTPNMDMIHAQLEGVFDDWYVNEAEYTKYQNLDEEVLREALNKDKAYAVVKDEVVRDMLKEALVNFAKVNGTHTLAHEMVHAGSVEFMKENPSHDYTKRVEDLFKLAVTNKESVLHHMGVGANEYWATSKEEFIAEGLSNPDLVYALTHVKVEGQPKFFNLFREMLETLCKMVGVNKKDNAYTYLLDGYLAMMHSQVPQTIEGAKRLDKLHEQLKDVYTKRNIENLKDQLSC